MVLMVELAGDATERRGQDKLRVKLLGRIVTYLGRTYYSWLDISSKTVEYDEYKKNEGVKAWLLHVKS